MSSIFSKLFWRCINTVTDSIQGVKKVNRCVSRLSIVILLMFSYSANGQIAPFDTDISLFIDRKSNLKSLLSVQDSNIIVGYLDAIDYFFYKNKSLIHFSSCMKRKYWPHEWKSMGEEEVGNINYEVLKSVDKAAKYIKRQYYIDTMSLSYFLIRFGMEIYFCDTVLRVLAESDEFITSLVSPDSYFVPPLSHLRSDMDGELFGIDRGYLLAVSAAEYVVSVV